MRPRRPASPPRSQYARAEGYLDADEKRAYAGSGDLKRAQGAPSLAFMKTGEWRVLAFVTTLALFVRLFRLSQPDSVVWVLFTNPPHTQLLMKFTQFRRGPFRKVRVQIYQDPISCRRSPTSGQITHYVGCFRPWV